MFFTEMLDNLAIFAIAINWDIIYEYIVENFLWIC